MFDSVAESRPLLSHRYKIWLVALLLAVGTLNFADRAVLSVLAQPIKEDLKLTDADLGMLQGLGFAILYSVLGLPLGWLAERVSRKGLIAVCVAIWSFMSMASGAALSFGGMLLSRIGVGVGEAGFLPATSSLTADHFKADRRGSILSIILLGAPFGFLIGQSLGGWIAVEWNWRVAFLALGAPGLAVALLVALTLKEPQRGLADGRAADPSSSLRAVLGELWSKRSFGHLLAGSMVSGLTFNAVSQFVLLFYLRTFNMPLALLGAVFGAVAFTSNGLGTILGGFGVDRLARRDARWLMWGPAVVLTMATPLYLGAFASSRVELSLALIWLANFVVVSYTAPTLAGVQNLVGARMRAFATALYALAMGLVGVGLGPTVLGMLSDYFAGHMFVTDGFTVSCPGGRAAPGAVATLDDACRAASAAGLRYALISMQPLYLWAAAHFLFAARTFRRDLDAPVTEHVNVTPVRGLSRTSST